MVDRKYTRMSAINKIAREWKSLPKLPENSETFKSLIFTICAEFGIARRTAIEYIYTARGKLIMEEKEAARIEEQIMREREKELVNQDQQINALISSLEAPGSKIDGN